VVSAAYEHLARLSIYVEVARQGEMTAQHDRHHVHFERLFHRLEADAVGGLYTVMCALSGVYRPLGGPSAAVLEPAVVEDIRTIRVPRPRRHALRHFRDYNVATSVRQVAQSLVSNVRRLAGSYHR